MTSETNNQQQQSATCQGTMPAAPISEAWLRQHGWVTDGDRGGLIVQVPGQYALFVKINWFKYAAKWNVLVTDSEPKPDGEIVFIRNMGYTWELVRLWEGLTGRAWVETDEGRGGE